MVLDRLLASPEHLTCADTCIVDGGSYLSDPQHHAHRYLHGLFPGHAAPRKAQQSFRADF